MNLFVLTDGEKARLIKPEERKRGRIAWSVYVYYIMKCGLILVGTVVSTRVIDASLILTSQFWLSNWSESTTRYEPDEVCIQMLLNLYYVQI